LSLGDSRPRQGPVHGRSIALEAAGDLGRRRAGIVSTEHRLALVGRQHTRTSETHASCLGPVAALAGPGTDQRALELGEPAQDGQHELAMRRRGVGPGALERPEAGASLFHVFENVEEVARGARQAVQASDDEHVVGLKPLNYLPQLGAVAARARGLL
jgi:hypothetical protein